MRLVTEVTRNLRGNKQALVGGQVVVHVKCIKSVTRLARIRNLFFAIKEIGVFVSYRLLFIYIFVTSRRQGN